MRLNINEPFSLFQTLDSIINCDLPSFTVLTGLNGSGKSQIFEGLVSGKITCEGVTPKQVTRISYRDILDGRNEGDTIERNCNIFLANDARESKDWYSIIQKLCLENLFDGNHENAKSVVQYLDSKKSLWTYEERDLSSGLWAKIQKLIRAIEDRVFDDPGFKDYEYHKNIIQSFKRYGTFDNGSSLRYYKFIDMILCRTVSALGKEYESYVDDRDRYAREEYDSGRSGSITGLLH